MLVRSLQTYLSSQNLINVEDISLFANKRIGIDAIYWLRSLPNLKDPLADAIGGLPPCLFKMIDRCLDYYESKSIDVIFVFQGIQPKNCTSNYTTLHTQIDEGWKYIARGELFLAQQHFAQATSRITSDFVFAATQYLMSKKKHVITAPFFSIVQLLYLASIGAIDAIFGPPSCILFGIPQVIIGINSAENRFDWIRQSTLLEHWGITEKQFIEACLLAGTEYCYTFPCFNLLQENGEKFYFGAAIDFIKQASLMFCVQHLFNGESQMDYLNGYAVCNAIMKHLLALHVDGHIRPVLRNAITEGNTNSNNNLFEFPNQDDLKNVFGLPLPDTVYILMSRQLITRKIPSVLALGYWRDSLCPIVDSIELCEILKEVMQYRRRALGLVAMRLPEVFHNRNIKFLRYNNNPNNQNSSVMTATPDCRPGMPWCFTAQQLENEMIRQDVKEITFRFCLNWHANELANDRTLLATHLNRQSLFLIHVFTAVPKEPVVDIYNLKVLRATIHFMILENLGLFTPEGRATIFGSALGSSSEFQEETLISLELMRTGNLMGEPLEPTPERPAPTKHAWLRKPESLPNQLPILLLSRVVSLVPLHLNDTDLWLQPVDYDLAGFHAIVRIIKKTLRLLMEACLANLLLKDIKAAQNIPVDEMSPLLPSLPIFQLNRNCLGIIFKHFLESDFDHNFRNFTFTDSAKYMAFQRRWKKLEHELITTYQCCKYPINDIFKAIRFWLRIYRVVKFLGQNVDIGCLKSDMEEAHTFLLNKIYLCGLHNHFLFDHKSLSSIRAEIATMFPQKDVVLVTDKSIPPFEVVLEDTTARVAKTMWQQLENKIQRESLSSNDSTVSYSLEDPFSFISKPVEPNEVFQQTSKYEAMATIDISNLKDLSEPVILSLIQEHQLKYLMGLGTQTQKDAFQPFQIYKSPSVSMAMASKASKLSDLAEGDRNKQMDKDIQQKVSRSSTLTHLSNESKKPFKASTDTNPLLTSHSDMRKISSNSCLPNLTDGCSSSSVAKGAVGVKGLDNSISSFEQETTGSTTVCSSSATASGKDLSLTTVDFLSPRKFVKVPVVNKINSIISKNDVVCDSVFFSLDSKKVGFESSASSASLSSSSNFLERKVTCKLDGSNIVTGNESLRTSNVFLTALPTAHFGKEPFRSVDYSLSGSKVNRDHSLSTSTSTATTTPTVEKAAGCTTLSSGIQKISDGCQLVTPKVPEKDILKFENLKPPVDCNPMKQTAGSNLSSNGFLASLHSGNAAGGGAGKPHLSVIKNANSTNITFPSSLNNQFKTELQASHERSSARDSVSSGVSGRHLKPNILVNKIGHVSWENSCDSSSANTPKKVTEPTRLVFSPTPHVRCNSQYTLAMNVDEVMYEPEVLKPLPEAKSGVEPVTRTRQSRSESRKRTSIQNVPVNVTKVVQVKAVSNSVASKGVNRKSVQNKLSTRNMSIPASHTHARVSNRESVFRIAQSKQSVPSKPLERSCSVMRTKDSGFAADGRLNITRLNTREQGKLLETEKAVYSSKRFFSNPQSPKRKIETYMQRTVGKLVEKIMNKYQVPDKTNDTKKSSASSDGSQPNVVPRAAYTSRTTRTSARASMYGFMEASELMKKQQTTTKSCSRASTNVTNSMITTPRIEKDAGNTTRGSKLTVRDERLSNAVGGLANNCNVSTNFIQPTRWVPQNLIASKATNLVSRSRLPTTNVCTRSASTRCRKVAIL